MERQGGANDEAARGGRASREELEELDVPPSAVGDVDDAVAPKDGGAITQRYPPGQEAGEADGDEREGSG